MRAKSAGHPATQPVRIILTTHPHLPQQSPLSGDGRVSFEEFAAYLHTSDAEALDLFPSRRLAKGAKRTALSVAEQRRRASSPAPAGGE